MSESDIHKQLVVEIQQYIEGKDANICVFIDDDSALKSTKPKLIAGFRPDIYARSLDSGKEYIGEAKTENDIDNKHTLAQLKAYAEYSLNKLNVEIILSVPIIAVGSIMSLARCIQKETGCDLNIFKFVYRLDI